MSLNKNNNINLENEDFTSFNRLLELQTLLKKESALKELFIKTGIETKKSIDQQCIDIYKKKMEVLNILQVISQEKPKGNKSNKNSSQPENLKEYILVENNYNYLSVLNTYIPNLLTYLWEDPKLVAKLLINADKDDTKKYLAPLICNNFYENILSSNYIEDPLMYVIYILLDNEINNIEDIKNSDSFLNQTQCSYLLSQLIEKKDVKDFFKIILENIIEELGSNKFNFNIGEIEQNQIHKKNSINKFIFNKNIFKSDSKEIIEKDILKESNILDNNMVSGGSLNNKKIENEIRNIMRDSIHYDLFSSKYMVSISFNDLQQKINRTEDETLKDYYKYLLLNANEDKDAYSQTNFIDSICDTRNSENILVLYQQDFIKTIEFIDKLFKNLNDNYRIVPYSIKSVCKIIYKLVTNKFPNANHIEKNLLISKFFFQIIFIPILLKPDINALINNYIISNNIIHNSNIISNIILKLVSFQLYKNYSNLKGEDYTPFNIYFLDKIPEVFEFYKKISKVKLPSFINELLKKNKSIEEYNFNYFIENPDKVLFHKSMLLNIDEFNALFKNLINNKDILLLNKNENNDIELDKKDKIFLRSLNKINSTDNKKLLEELLEHKEYTTIKTEKISESIFSKKIKIIEEKRQNIHYFHISELLFNDKYKKIFSLEQKNPCYHIKEIKETKEIDNKELINKNNIIKAKNFISSILYNYRVLEKSDFNVGSIINIFDILKELKLFMKTSNFLIDGNIPSEWYISALTECLQKLPNKYKDNDYKLLFEELIKELEDSIKEYNFEYMSVFIDKMKYAKRNKIYFNETKEIYMDIELNNRANDIIENEAINITIYYKFNDKKNEFYIYKEGIKDKQLEFLDSFRFETDNKGKLCKTIEQFTKNFPNLNKRLSLEDQVIDENEIGIFDIQKQLEFPKNLKIFFDYVSERLKNIEKNEKDLNIIKDKIYDYVMSKIYKRIYPKEKHQFDEQIFQNAVKISWIEPNNIINSKTHFDFDLVLPDINKYFNLIRTEKSPRKKFINLNNIITSINRLLFFNSGATKIGVDDQIPALTYCFVKAKPKRIFTDCKFMELYIGDKKNKGEDNELTQMRTVCDFIKQVKAKSLFNVDEEEFNQKSELSLQHLNSKMN